MCKCAPNNKQRTFIHILIFFRREALEHLQLIQVTCCDISVYREFSNLCLTVFGRGLSCKVNPVIIISHGSIY